MSGSSELIADRFDEGPNPVAPVDPVHDPDESIEHEDDEPGHDGQSSLPLLPASPVEEPQEPAFEVAVLQGRSYEKPEETEERYAEYVHEASFNKELKGDYIPNL